MYSQNSSVRSFEYRIPKCGAICTVALLMFEESNACALIQVDDCDVFLPKKDYAPLIELPLISLAENVI